MPSTKSPQREAAAGLFAAWFIHDVEEAVAFPSTSRLLAKRLGTNRVLVSQPQSLIAIGLMGVLVATACIRGAKSDGNSRLYRAVLAGLEGHVITHIAGSIAMRRYTAGVITAPLIMLPGARRARVALRRGGVPLTTSDTVRGGALLLAAAFVSHAVARRLAPALLSS